MRGQGRSLNAPSCNAERVDKEVNYGLHEAKVTALILTIFSADSKRVAGIKTGPPIIKVTDGYINVNRFRVGLPDFVLTCIYGGAAD